MARAKQVKFDGVVFARQARPVTILAELFEHQVDQPTTALSETGAERKPPQAIFFAAFELIAGDTAGLELEIATTDGAVQGVSGDNHPGACLARRRTDDRVDADQHRRAALTP